MINNTPNIGRLRQRIEIISYEEIENDLGETIKTLKIIKKLWQK